jgi:hypothetical protein
VLSYTNRAGNGTASAETDGSPPYTANAAFDENPIGTFFESNTVINWLKYDFGSISTGTTYKINAMSMRVYDSYEERAPRDFYIAGSNNDSDYTILGTIVDQNYDDLAASNSQVFNWHFTNGTAYRYIKLFVKTVQAGTILRIADVRYYEGTAQGAAGPAGSAGPAGAAGPAGPAGAKGATGDKYAIVPSQNEGVYVGLICTEMPEPRFEDVIKIPVFSEGKSSVEHEISETFRFVVEESTIEIISCVPSDPVIWGGYVKDGKIFINFDGGKPEFVTVKISAIRSGRLDRRFSTYTKEEADKNVRFWDSWRS